MYLIIIFWCWSIIVSISVFVACEVSTPNFFPLNSEWLGGVRFPGGEVNMEVSFK